MTKYQIDRVNKVLIGFGLEPLTEEMHISEREKIENEAYEKAALEAAILIGNGTDPTYIPEAIRSLKTGE